MLRTGTIDRSWTSVLGIMPFSLNKNALYRFRIDEFSLLAASPLFRSRESCFADSGEVVWYNIL